MDAIAAIHGEYRRLKTSSEAAALVVMATVTDPLNKISRVDTTLSLAMIPLISDVHIRQSPSPKGLNNGTRSPAIAARILSCESLTIFRCRSKL